jgi:filamentous hemagglutinin family protein
MKIRPTLHLATLIPFLAAGAHAEVTLDGSLGRAGALPGPNYQIGADLGQQHGGNLFHSFRDFNLQSHESATFSGPANVQNVISRVTGGNPSNIDGTLRSTIPNADMYFLNPYGIMFGPNAKLDVQGGFHVSTADYLRLQDGGRFEARVPSNSLLTVAPVAAFGFLTDTPATITTQDSTLIVPPLKPLSLIGGNLHLQGTLPVQFDNANTYATFASSLLHTTSGPLHLAAVGSTGEVLVNNNDFTLTGRGGEIRLDRTLVDTSGPGSGNLKIRGRWLWMQDSTLQANVLGDFDGGLMDLQLTESLQATSNSYQFLSFASEALQGRGNGGAIAIQVPELTLNRVKLGTEAISTANAGSVDLTVNRLSIFEGGGIASSALGGKTGPLTIKATESILVSGQTRGTWVASGIMFTDVPSYIDSTAYMDASTGGDIKLMTPRLDVVGGTINAMNLGRGNASNIFIQANNVNVTAGGAISASAMNIGLAGNIFLTVTDTLFLSGRRAGSYVEPITNMRFDNNQSSITSFSRLGAGGQLHLTAKTIQLTEEAVINNTSLGLGEKSNGINLQADHLLLTEGAQINSSNGAYAGVAFLKGEGIGGNIHIETKQLTLSNQHPHLQRTGIFSDTYSQRPEGLGGNLLIQTDSLDITGDAAISARSYGLGDAGRINLQVHHLHLAQHGSISTAAAQAGGGNIVLNGVSGLLYLYNSEITTSVATGQGGGGNITIERPQFVVMNKGKIIAQADAGHGGNIHIVAEQFLKTPDSLVSASSRVGLDGHVRIDSPDQHIGDSLLGSPKEFTDVSGLLPRLCENMSFEEFLNRSTFYVYPIAGSSLSPYDLKPSHAFRSFPTLPTTGQATVSQERRAVESQRLAWLTGCHS